MKSVGEIGLKIPARTREYYRYTGASAKLEQRGSGCSRPELAWAHRQTERTGRSNSEVKDPDPKADSTGHANDSGIEGQDSLLQHPQEC